MLSHSLFLNTWLHILVLELLLSQLQFITLFIFCVLLIISCVMNSHLVYILQAWKAQQSIEIFVPRERWKICQKVLVFSVLCYDKSISKILTGSREEIHKKKILSYLILKYVSIFIEKNLRNSRIAKSNKLFLQNILFSYAFNFVAKFFYVMFHLIFTQPI